MFKAIINSTPFTSDVANDFFRNITGDSFNRDLSFVATLRALVAPRMKDEEKLCVYFTNSSYTASQIGSDSAKRMVKNICDLDYMNEGTILIHNFNNRNQDDNVANLELMKSTFCEVYKDWARIENVTLFFKKTFYVLCFVNPSTRQVVIFTDSLDVRKHHYLQCAILAFLPWYFNPDEGVSEQEMELIKALREKTATAYEDCLAKLASQYNFKHAKIRKLLAGFETRYERLECDRMERNIMDCISSIDDYNQQIASLLRDKREYEIRLLGLEAKIASSSEESEIMEYFISNDKLSLSDVTDRSMTFEVKDYLTFFDDEMAMTMIKNRNSYIYLPRGRACNNIIPADDMEMFMTALVDRKIHIKFCAAYKFTFGGNVEPLAGHSYGSEFRDSMPNPHIDRYRCMGNYSRTINELLKNNDYIMALEQSVASCKSLNFGDSPVMQEFMCRLYGIRDNGANNRCVELPDGSIVTPKEAIEYLKTEAEANE